MSVCELVNTMKALLLMTIPRTLGFNCTKSGKSKNSLGRAIELRFRQIHAHKLGI